VNEDTAPTPESSSMLEGLRGLVLRRPLATAVAVYAVVAFAAALAAYFAIFTQFASYDDEGTILMTLRAFVHGEALYRDVYSAYGPFYYELFGGFFALTGRAVTTDAGRLIVVFVWVGISLAMGLVAQRLTRSLALGVAGMIATFGALFTLINEPMHPQGLCALLLAVFILLVVSDPQRRSLWLGGGAGAVLGALLLTKVNLGVFAIAATVLAAVCTVGPLYRRRWLRYPVIAAFLLMPLFVTARDFGQGWVRELLLVEGLATIAILVAAHPARPRSGDRDEPLLRWLLAALAGLAAAFVAILLVILVIGTSPAEVYDGIVTQALRIRDVLVLPFQAPSIWVNWAIIGVAVATLTAWLRGWDQGPPRAWPGVLRLLVGLEILLGITRITPLGFDPSGGNQDVMGLVLAWVAAVPLSGRLEPPERRLLRVLLPALAVAETLQVYPVAGSQASIAAIGFVPVAALCLADGATELRAWGAARGGVKPLQVGAVLGVASVTLATIFAVTGLLSPTATHALLYRDQPSLDLPGATLLHLPAPTAQSYQEAVGLVRDNRCTALVGYPNVNSIYLWSGLEAPRPQLPNAWMNAYDADQQQRVVNQLRSSPRPCVLYNESLAPFYLSEPPPDRPLVHYIFDEATPVAEAGGFQLRVPKGDR
jgi:hypothetical protein